MLVGCHDNLSLVGPDGAVAVLRGVNARKRDDPVSSSRCAGVFSYMLSSLFITQSIAEWIGTLEVNRWVLMGPSIFSYLSLAFSYPRGGDSMAAPILLPIIIDAGFDPYWFAVVLTINMEIAGFSAARWPQSLCNQWNCA